MEHESRSVDLEPAQRASPLPIRVGVLASGQWGVVTHGQLLAIGFSASAIQRACTAGRLHRRHHGVYAVGHTALRLEGRWLAAVLACGAGAVLSHRSAAALWDLRPSSHSFIDVTAALRGRVSPHGVRLRGTARLALNETTIRSGVPVTTVSRTLADLAAVLGHRDLERTFERAEALHVLDMRSVLASARCRPGAPVVRHILDAWQPAATRSELEVALLRLVVNSGLPRPEVNARVGEFEVDLLWRASRLVVEADSIAFHLTRAAMERDRRRDAVLARDGHRVLRFTDRQVRRRPNEVTTAIRAALG